MALILATMRDLIRANSFSRDNLWKDGPFPFGTSMAGKTLGIAGLEESALPSLYGPSLSQSILLTTIATLNMYPIRFVKVLKT